MRRWAAVAVLVGVVSVPSLRVCCEIACAGAGSQPQANEAVTHCHESATSMTGPAVQHEDQCGSHAQEPAIIAELRAHHHIAAPSASQAGDRVASTAIDSGRLLRQIVSDGSISPPIPPGNTVLRI